MFPCSVIMSTISYWDFMYCFLLMTASWYQVKKIAIHAMLDVVEKLEKARLVIANFRH